jgi:hypothetical protein
VAVTAIEICVTSDGAVSANPIVGGAADDASRDGVAQALNAIRISSGPITTVLMRAIIHPDLPGGSVKCRRSGIVGPA